MDDLLPLWSRSPALARNTDPGTSHMAAKAMTPHVNELETVLLKALRESPNGLTMHELVDKTGLWWNTASPRMRPLARKGLVRDSGERRVGRTGKKCIVWKVTATI